MSASLPTVAILAGGLATRLGAAAAATPKCLVDVNGEPFLLRQARLLASRGVTRVVVLAGHRGEQVAEARDRLPWPPGLEISVRMDGPCLLGTAGAIRRALAHLGDPFFVLYGDSYLACDHRAVHARFVASTMPALMTIHRNENRWEPSNVESDGRIVRHYDKRAPTGRMRHIDYGLGLFRAAVFDTLADGEAADLADLYAALAARGQLAAHEVPERFYEIGSPRGLAELRDHLAGGTRLATSPDAPSRPSAAEHPS
ncbi:MAG: NTP transferase domain-containing protein [bacterium]